MQRLKVDVEVSKELFDLTNGLVSFIKDIKQTLEDGYQLGEDFPQVLMSAVNHLIPAVDGISKVPEDVKNDMKGFIYACGLMGGDLYDIMVPKEEAPALPPTPEEPGLPSD